MKTIFNFNNKKNQLLLQERGIGFEQIICLIKENGVLDILKHHNQEKYKDQKIYVIDVEGYCYLVPFVEENNVIFLKTIIPSRKATKLYGIKNGK